jgi:hypothetical protein
VGPRFGVALATWRGRLVGDGVTGSGRRRVWLKGGVALKQGTWPRRWPTDGLGWAVKVGHGPGAGPR